MPGANTARDLFDAVVTSEDPGNGGIIVHSIETQIVEIRTGAVSETRTLEAPRRAGKTLRISMFEDGGGDCTILTDDPIDIQGNTSFVLDSVGDNITLVSVSKGSTGAFCWSRQSHVGVSFPLGDGVGGGTLTEGDKGDVLVTNSGDTWTIDTNTVTFAKMQDIATSRMLGRVTAGTGDPEELTAAQVRTFINVAEGADVTDASSVNTAGAVMNTDTSTAAMQFVIDEDSFATDSATKVPTQQSVKAYVDTVVAAIDTGSALTDGDKGDVTVSSTGTVFTIDNKAVTVAKFQDIATASILGRLTSGTGSVEQLTASQIRSFVNVENGADVTDATNVAAAGAVMSSQTSISGAGFVIDEDSMATDTTSKIPTQQSVKAYVDNQIAAIVDPTQIIYRRAANGTLTESYSLQGTANAAARGVILENALSEMVDGDRLSYSGEADFEIDDFIIEDKVKLRVRMPNATFCKPTSSTSLYMIRLGSGLRNCVFDFGVFDVNAQNTGNTSRDTAVALGGGYNNRIRIREIINARRPWSAWNSGTAYTVGQGVYLGEFGNTNGGNMQWYYCNQNHTNQKPVTGTSTYWTEKANSAIEMDVWFVWTSGSAYSNGTIVWYAQAYWKATGTTTAGVAPGEGVANWTLAGEDAPVGWKVRVDSMHNPGQKGIRLGGDNTELHDSSFSQDPANEFNIPQTHTAFDYWRSGGLLTIRNVKLTEISAEAGTNNEELQNMVVDGFDVNFSTTRGTNTTSVKFQCMRNFRGKRMRILNPINDNRASFKITVQLNRAYITDSQFSGWIGMEGDTKYERCRFGHEDNAMPDMFYAMNDGRHLHLVDCDIINVTNAINRSYTVDDAMADTMNVILDNVRCTAVTNLFNDVRRSDQIVGRNVTGYTNVCNYAKTWSAKLDAPDLDPYSLRGTGLPTSGYWKRGTRIINTTEGSTVREYICKTSGWASLGALPSSGTAVTKGDCFVSSGALRMYTGSGTIGTASNVNVVTTAVLVEWQQDDYV